MTEEQACKLFEVMVNTTNDDLEMSHMAADKVLCTVLKELGYTKLVEMFESLNKWYA